MKDRKMCLKKLGLEIHYLGGVAFTNKAEASIITGQCLLFGFPSAHLYSFVIDIWCHVKVKTCST